jgi:predicted  nucleic acid-binding Zn-ribbon protein
MSQQADDVRERIERAAEKLARLRDEIGVQLHLGGAEAKQVWQRLEPEVERAWSRLEEAARHVTRGLHDESVTLEAHLALMDARDRLREIQPTLQAVRERIKRAGSGALASIPDPVKLEARLASMDLADAVQRRRAAIAEELRQAGSLAHRLVDEIAKLLEKARAGHES